MVDKYIIIMEECLC